MTLRDSIGRSRAARVTQRVTYGWPGSVSVVLCEEKDVNARPLTRFVSF